jgi:hypothetical protein
VLRDRTGGRDETGFGFRRGDRSRAGGGAAEVALVGVTETPAGGLDVSTGALAGRVNPVVRQSVQAGQAGSGRQEHQQQEERFGLDQSHGHWISIAGKTQSLRGSAATEAIQRAPFPICGIASALRASQ